MTDLDESTLVSLAERYIENSGAPPDPELRRVLRERVETWEERLAGLDEDDPLYDTIAADLDEKRERYRALVEDDPEAKRELLAAAADGFVPQGKWLGEPVLEALNRLLYGKFGKTLIVSQQIVEPGTTLGSDETYEVAMAVREAAQEELAALEDGQA